LGGCEGCAEDERISIDLSIFSDFLSSHFTRERKCIALLYTFAVTARRYKANAISELVFTHLPAQEVEMEGRLHLKPHK
jgi:hypothetical protein